MFIDEPIKRALANLPVNCGPTLQQSILNQGSSAAEGVTATIVPDEAATVLGAATVDAGTIGAGESRSYNWARRVIDETRVLRTFQIELTSDNALTIPGTGTYNVGLSVAVEEIVGELPSAYSLEPSYPNPFNPSTSITFSVPATGHVVIRVFDILGREVTTLVDEVAAAGTYRTTFDAGRLPSGAYMYRMEAGEFTAVKSAVLVK